MPPFLNHDAFNQGRHAYDTGMSVHSVAVKSYADLERAMEQHADHRAIEAESKSFVLGFASGLVDDIRRIAGGTRPGGLRA